MRARRLTIKQRKEIFQALVQTQDMGTMSNSESMDHIGLQYKIDQNQLQTIVDEGIDKDWLDEAFVGA
jgi:hypothetical protein